MRMRTHLIGAAATAVGLAAAGAGVGVARQRRKITGRAPEEHPAFGSLRADPVTVVADDGTPLHVEVDEADSDVTLVFCHGYALNLDCWHFQREHYRGRVRSIYYDQRSHGRSGRSPMGNATIDQLGRDLETILENLTDGPVVLVGHSMGGMTVVALAEQFPDLLGDRVVGTALISTTAGGLDPSRILLPVVPGQGAASGAVRRGVATLARGHRAVDGLRRLGHNVALVATDQLAFGDDVPASYVEFVDQMLSDTPFEVVAQFFPGFGDMDKFDHVGVLAKVPTTVICGTDDKMTSIGHSRKLHAQIDGSELLECLGAGHMVILERATEVNGELDRLLAATGADA